MKQIYVFICILCLLNSCNSIKSIAINDGALPFLGTVGKQETNLLKSNFVPVGSPTLTKPIQVTVKTIPFDKSSNKVYETSKELTGSKSAITYIDSLPNKPKYTVFSLHNKVGLKEVINQEQNQELKNYLVADSDYKIVSTISVLLTSDLAMEISGADGFFLSTDSNGLLQLEILNDNQKRKINIPQEELFDYTVMGVCWSENRYGKPMIETFSEYGKCPKGTEKNANKLNELQSSLKL
ncbi:hypothetical protein SAMN04488007_2085 [Maribacter aquivivus]|uniref:Lipoprotein n=1 Tax=Maribacter aquivivus TaxID=228958 RepID=A0A1M6PWV5_9FLAO|nr:hypothetical protein [Maribacter aquivivus]SHK12399.1 hypothetical protein SAMN04488007_2085 [Maribacter aquivivus]